MGRTLCFIRFNSIYILEYSILEHMQKKAVDVE